MSETERKERDARRREMARKVLESINSDISVNLPAGVAELDIVWPSDTVEEPDTP